MWGEWWVVFATHFCGWLGVFHISLQEVRPPISRPCLIGEELWDYGEWLRQQVMGHWRIELGKAFAEIVQSCIGTWNPGYSCSAAMNRFQSCCKIFLPNHARVWAKEACQTVRLKTGSAPNISGSLQCFSAKDVSAAGGVCKTGQLCARSTTMKAEPEIADSSLWKPWSIYRWFGYKQWPFTYICKIAIYLWIMATFLLYNNGHLPVNNSHLLVKNKKGDFPQLS